MVVWPRKVQRCELPPLFSGDPLFSGYWASAGAAVHDWRGDLATCLEASSGRFVAVLPDLPKAGSQCVVRNILADVRDCLRRGALTSVILLFRDGLRVSLRRGDRFRFWRNSHVLLENPDS